jgi:Winged helix DNA-binding domain
VRSEDYPWLHALTAPMLVAGSARRLAQEGLSPSASERGVALIEQALAADGPLGRRELRERLITAGIPSKGQALLQLLLLASLRGLTVRGPMVDGEHAYVLVRDWLGEHAPVDRQRALGELVSRYLAGHGPASERDLAKWAGLPIRDVREGLRGHGSALVVHSDGLVDLAGRRAETDLPAPRLLGAFDPVLMGWRSREPLLDPRHAVVTVNGLFRPFALVGGRAAARWSIEADRLALEPFAPLSPAEVAALELDAQDVRRFLGLAPPP